MSTIQATKIYKLQRWNLIDNRNANISKQYEIKTDKIPLFLIEKYYNYMINIHD